MKNTQVIPVFLLLFSCSENMKDSIPVHKDETLNTVITDSIVQNNETPIATEIISDTTKLHKQKNVEIVYKDRAMIASISSDKKIPIFVHKYGYVISKIYIDTNTYGITRYPEFFAQHSKHMYEHVKLERKSAIAYVSDNKLDSLANIFPAAGNLVRCVNRRDVAGFLSSQIDVFFEPDVVIDSSYTEYIKKNGDIMDESTAYQLIRLNTINATEILKTSRKIEKFKGVKVVYNKIIEAPPHIEGIPIN